MNRPPKLLKGTLDITTAISSSSWNAVINAIVAQPHPAYTDPNTLRTYYDGRDIAVGDYITTTASGKCLKILSISNQSDVSVTCVLGDDEELNRSIDSAGDGRILEGEGYIFEVKNGIPVIFPLPSGLAAGFTFTFAGQLLSRFLAKNGISLPEDIITDEDLGQSVASLINGKVPISQLPVGTNPATNVAPGGDYLSAISLGQTVAPLIDGKIPPSYIPSIQDNFEIVTAYSDLLNIATPSTSIYYVVTTENAIYKWTGTTFIRISGDVEQTSYSFVSVTQSDTLYNANIKNVISVIGNNVTIVLPSIVENGDDVIILNSGSGTIIDPNGLTIRNSNSAYNLPDTQYSTYLVYVDGWRFSESNQLVNIYTQQPGADQFGPADYWPAGTEQTMQNISIFGKDAYVESWISTKNQILTILSYTSINTTNVIRGVTTNTSGWAAKNVELGINGDSIVISGAVPGATGYGDKLNGTWEITRIVSSTEFEFIITNNILNSTPMVSGIGNTIRIIKENLAEQTTIFEPNSDNFRSIWFPKTGFALERRVQFDTNLMPNVKYYNNLVINICKMLNLNWRNYETINDFINIDSNFKAVLDRQVILSTISSNSDFINDFINCRTDKYIETPTMSSNNSPTGNIVTGTSKLSGSDYYYAFDNSLDTAWQSNNLIENQSLQIAMPSTNLLFPYSFTIYTKSPDLSPKNIKLEYKDAFNEWATAGEFVLSNDTIEDTFFIFKQGISSNVWRFTFTDCYSEERMAVNNIKLRGWNTYGM